MNELNEVIDIDQIYELRKQIHYNDKFVHVKNIIKQQFIDWDSVIEQTFVPSENPCIVLNKTNSYEEPVTSIQINTINNDPDRSIHSVFMDTGLNATPCDNVKDYLESGHTIALTQYEFRNNVCRDILNLLLDVFYLNITDHGIWPANVNQYSGNAHLYASLAGSNSYNPHCDPYSNFVFQIDGETDVVIYKNKACQLMDHDIPILINNEHRKEIIDGFEIDEEITLKPGDMLYIPNRVYNWFKPKTNRLSLSFPLIMKGPLAS